ncbi:MAG TPA: phospholipase [Clostridiales bacterium]|nr:phospholipase [Clostridiales bacterium]
MKLIEKSYDYFLKAVLKVSNPIKKSIVNTHCNVHKFINILALHILANDKYESEYNFFISFIDDINKGAVWADQDFKSTHHFYHPYKKKGLYGRKNAMDLAKEYYSQALTLWNTGEFNKSLFYLGAALHLIHDMTIPQHANIRLLDNHRQYETFVKRTYQYVKEFQAKNGAYKLDTIEEYIKFNARIALKIHKRYKNVKNDEERYYLITKCNLPLSQRTTAGAMIMFYHDIFGETKKPRRPLQNSTI